jgi:SAM-dependent methyltransferase
MLASLALDYSALSILEFVRFAVTPVDFFLTDTRWPPIRSAPGAFLLNVIGRSPFARVKSRCSRARSFSISPEPSLTAFIRSKGLKSYKTCDLFKPDVDLRIDICNIELPDQSFDLVLCLHVLEHVPDDRKAMSELRRILRPSGMAIIMVPLEEGLDETYENPSIVSEADRLIHFGQEDHVRYYGRDLRDRLRGAGFSIREWVSKEPYVLKHGLKRGERIFLCTRVE